MVIPDKLLNDETEKLLHDAAQMFFHNVAQEFPQIVEVPLNVIQEHASLLQASEVCSNI